MDSFKDYIIKITSSNYLLDLDFLLGLLIVLLLVILFIIILFFTVLIIFIKKNNKNKKEIERLKKENKDIQLHLDDALNNINNNCEDYLLEDKAYKLFLESIGYHLLYRSLKDLSKNLISNKKINNSEKLNLLKVAVQKKKDKKILKEKLKIEKKLAEDSQNNDSL